MKKKVHLNKKVLLVVITMFLIFAKVFGQRDSTSSSLILNPNVENYSSKIPYMNEFIQLRVDYSTRKYDVIITAMGQSTRIVHLEIEDSMVKRSSFKYGSYLPVSEKDLVFPDFQQSLITGFYQCQIVPAKLHSDFLTLQIFESDKLIFRVLIDGVSNYDASGCECKLIDDLLKLAFK